MDAIKEKLTQDDFGWTSSSDLHVSKVANKYCPEVEQKIEHAVEALKLILKTKPTMLVSAEEFVGILLSDFPRPYSQPSPRGGKNVKNPKTGNYYTPVAVQGDFLFLVRGWSNASDTCSWRVRVVMQTGVGTKFDKVEDEVEEALATMSVAEAKAKEEQEAKVKAAVEIFDYTPSPRALNRVKEAAKLAQKVQANSGGDW